MKIPYNFIQPSGNVVFAARGGKIHSFSLQDGSHLSTWEHPDVEKVAAASAAAAAAKVEIEVSSSVPTPTSPADGEEDGPPAKRQRLEKEDEQSKDDGDAMVVDEPPKHPEQENEKRGKKDRRKGNRGQNQGQKANNRGSNVFARVPDQPVITLMTTTSDGSHLLAISGHDKSLWVFEHDGKGNLKELGQRIMPKRPCSVLICPGNETILSADKFGDVFSLPLIPTDKPAAAAAAAATGDADAGASTPAEESTPAPETQETKPFKPEASNFTVHSKANLRALRNQERESKKGKRDVTKEEPTFEHTLQIGHVSMLTAMMLAEKGSRRYIITADRDEHIRVSRYMPHAHVIEGFCLGHTNFVSALTLPSQDVLVSGGGDSEMFVWDWEAGKVLSKFDILEQARQVESETSKVAVSQLLSATVLVNGLPNPVVLAVCEGIPSIFVLRVSDQNTLSHVQTVSLPGNPLHVAPISSDGTLNTILVAVDPAESSTIGIVSYKWTGAAFSTTQDFTPQDASLSESEFDLTNEQVRKLLYNIGDLRKKGDDEQGEGEEGEQVEQTQEAS
ncbi:WD repeat domain-containing protein [Colletotrichum karsti]|uniref:WD repeat domain-containing protein n=1 Tax=Colletotrichum karsti TaxID=1095194 RepID=A0A9P6IBN0_9PEZI|nr:WD repeat domain-containing protein [Colletotrichum karsti]KAF9879859.1 WD repeat domain-containing protein [Colletotrichum karsti]